MEIIRFFGFMSGIVGVFYYLSLYISVLFKFVLWNFISYVIFNIGEKCIKKEFKRRRL